LLPVFFRRNFFIGLWFLFFQSSGFGPTDHRCFVGFLGG